MKSNNFSINNQLEDAEWIWLSHKSKTDEYAEFGSYFEADESSCKCLISCDGDYTLFINGSYVSSNQYGDFEHYKIYDEIELAPFLKNGKNELFVLVWHIGEDFQRYKNATAGVIFSISQGGRVILKSDTEVLCRESSAYLSGYRKKITPQLGFSFLYDKTKENEGVWQTSVAVNKKCEFFKRPTPRLQLLGAEYGRVLVREGCYCLIDLGRETVGIPTLAFSSPTEQKVTVSWSESLTGGKVCRRIGSRDFSFEYVSKSGENSYTNYMLRIACRYIELRSEQPITLHHLGVIPQVYPIEERSVSLANETDSAIYRTCVNTLKLCMMEHYVDTPWREQCLYAFDSRNQMLSGYRAFVGGNAEYARANLILLSKDRRDDGLLSICTPSGTGLTIPSFSLYYFLAVKEYVENTGDSSLAKEVFYKLVSIADAFVNNVFSGLVYRFTGECYWNFYDWTDRMKGNTDSDRLIDTDLMINCLFILALESLREISRWAGKPFTYGELLLEIKEGAKAAFYNESANAFSFTRGGDDFTELGNSLAILAGIAGDPVSLSEKIADGALDGCSLSMKCFKYDALLKTDRDMWGERVREEIRRDYTPMIESGSDTVWETSGGKAAFSGAGSLCHGWSAIPILYL